MLRLLYGDRLLYGGFIQCDSVKELEECPWFWSSAREEWIERPEWLKLKGDALTNAAEEDALHQ
jgi:hypothetical protein